MSLVRLTCSLIVAAMITRKIANWIWKHTEKVERFAFENDYVKTVEKGHGHFTTWNRRPEKVLDATSTHLASAHTAYKEASTRTPMLKGALRTAGWAVARTGAGIGTFVVRGGLGFGEWLVARGAQLAVILPVTVGVALPMAIAGTTVEVANLGALAGKAAVDFGKEVVARYKSLPKKAAEAPAVEAEGPAPVVAEILPAVEPAVEAPVVVAAAAVETVAAAAPVAPQPRLVVPARAVSRSVAGLGE